VLEPSTYEMHAWDTLEIARARPLTQFSRTLTGATGRAVEWVGGKTGKVVEETPWLRQTGESVQDLAKKVGDAVPDAAARWTSEASAGAQSFLRRMARVGLSPEKVVAKHVKAGNQITTLAELRSLDLELVDKVRGRNLDLGYAGAASVTGAGTALALTGGTVAIGSGVGAAPGALTVVGAIAADAAAALAISTRAVGHTALLYGYDPGDPHEKLIVRAVINVGAASTAAARSAALKDLSRLVQNLARGATWSTLTESVIAKALRSFATEYGVKFTQKTLAKAVPFVGVGLSATMNWATIESVMDAANRGYRRRFLLEKYPQLATGAPAVPTHIPDDREIDEDEISVVAIVQEALKEEEGGGEGTARSPEARNGISLASPHPDPGTPAERVRTSSMSVPPPTLSPDGP
jgi:hypothetical protein